MSNQRAGICYIVGAGSFAEVIAPGPLDFVIAADGGYLHLAAAGVRVDLLMGDFDSLAGIPDGVRVQRFPSEKDDTDMMIAIKAGLELGFRRFALYGSVGGRLDHTLANAQALRYLSRRGAAGYMMGEGMALTVIERGEQRFPARCRGLISVFSVGDTAEGVWIEGLKYPLRDARLTCDMPQGVSNEFTGVPARIGVKRGALLLLWWDGAFSPKEAFKLRGEKAPE